MLIKAEMSKLKTRHTFLEARLQSQGTLRPTVEDAARFICTLNTKYAELTKLHCLGNDLQIIISYRDFWQERLPELSRFP
jgi:hypothetical protein